MKIVVANHGSFIPLKYSLTDLITQRLQENNLCFMIYEVCTTHVHHQETEIKKWTVSYFLKSVNFSNDSFTNSSLKYCYFAPQIHYCDFQLKKQLVRHSTHFEVKISSAIRYILSETWFSQNRKHLAWFLLFFSHNE